VKKGQEMGVAEREVSELDTELQQGTETTEEESQDDTDGGGEEGTEGGEGTDDTGNGEGGEDEEHVIGFGSEEPPASEEAKAAPQWVKDLRRRQRELALENAELKAKLGTGHTGAAQKPALPAKPKLSDPVIDYDEEKFEQARDAWDAKKRELDSWEANQAKAVEEAQKATQAVHANYAASKQALKVKDFQDAEDEAATALDQVQQAILIKGASNPAALVYALGKDSKELQALASIKDPVKFAVAVGKLETKVKVTKRTSTKPAPESTVRGGSGSQSATSDTLKRLEAEADRTGDRSKVVAYKRQLQQQGKK
jgi:hypothetical protein